MIKLLLLFCTLFICTDAFAEPQYTEYIFDRYSETIPDTNDLIKYKPITMHKYYHMIETDILYAPKDFVSDNHVYFDENDYTISSTYYKTRLSEIETTHTVTLKSYENYLTDMIQLSMVNTGWSANYVYEIDVYDGDMLLNYTLNDNNFEWLNDDEIYKGYSMTNYESFCLVLDKPYKVENLKLKIYYIKQFTTKGTFNLEFLPVGFTKNIIDEEIILETTYAGNKITEINIMDEQTFNEFMPAKSLLILYEAPNLSICAYFVNNKYLYKYYNLKKEYYIDSEEKKIDGYVFDETEDYTTYKVYKRELIPEKVPIFKEIPIEDIKEEQSPEKTPSSKPIVKENVHVQKEQNEIHTEQENTVKSDYNELAYIDNTKTEAVKPKPNYLIIIGLSLISLSFIMLIIHYIRVKFENNND